jgi:plasmid stabilization system protein ParE
VVKLGNFKIVWDVEALNQFKEILEFLAEQSIQAPRIVKKAILDQIAQVKKNPQIFETDKLRSPVFCLNLYNINKRFCASY